MRKPLAVAVLTLTMVACEGDAGPMGPAGPAGPQGEPGPGTRLVLNTTVGFDGTAGVTLPAAAGTLSDPPALTCYVGEPGSGVFLAVGLDTYSGVTCGIGQTGSQLSAAMIGAPSGWDARFVVVY